MPVGLKQVCLGTRKRPMAVKKSEPKKSASKPAAKPKKAAPKKAAPKKK
jgi:hypothetical protein